MSEDDGWGVPKPRYSPEARGSEILEKALKRAIGRFASKYGISEDEARILLLDTGVRLP